MKLLVFDIGGTAIKQGCFIDDNLLSVKELPTNASLGGRHILNTISSLIEKESDYDAIGISTAGQINPETGTVLYANSNIPDYTGMQLQKELQNRFFVPVTVENDVNAAAVGEAFYGAGKDQTDFLCLTYGTGIGGAIIQNRTLYRGSGFSAAEFGAIVTHGDAKLLQTDFFDGCYERYASTTALVKKVMAYQPALTDGRKIFEAKDDPEVMKRIDAWIDEVLLGLSTLIHIFNPSCIILGGGIMAQPLILEKIQAGISRFIMPSFTNVDIRSAALGNSAALFGIYHLTRQALSATLV